MGKLTEAERRAILGGMEAARDAIAEVEGVSVSASRALRALMLVLSLVLAALRRLDEEGMAGIGSVGEGSEEKFRR